MMPTTTQQPVASQVDLMDQELSVVQTHNQAGLPAMICAVQSPLQQTNISLDSKRRKAGSTV
jgi:hypothetical protein